ncbi:MAG: hypothetical protein O2795_15340 [Acidobacteria bacterium]|nr:hypothetical protein [Acidobacteriota bacterium]
MTWTRFVLVALLTATTANSSSVKSWDISDYESFLPGTLKGISLTREGLLSLAPQVAELHKSDDAVVWTAASAADGSIYLGTGHQGHLYRIPATGDAQLLWTAPQIEIFALAAAPNGDVYAGTSPAGKVYKITPDGTATEFYDPGQEYIWQLQFGPAAAGGGFGGPQELYVGTGPSGRIYRVTADGQGELWFDTEQRHITALALDAEGRLLAAADPSGTLFRIDGKDRAFALYDSTLPEIRNIQAAADGSIYLAAMGGAISLSDNMVQSVSQAATTTTITVTATASGSGPGAGVQASPISTPTQSTPTISSRAAINYGVETAALILLRAGERAETLWTSTEENILAMTLEDANTALIATDSMGRLYRVNAQGDAVLLAQTDEQQITSLTPSARGLVMTSAHGSPTRLMATTRAASGRYETAPFDATAISTWGRLESRTTGAVTIQTRSGNTARPDKTWSDWSAVTDGAIASPAARYLQWAADFTAADQTLDTVRVAYLPANAKPVISSVSVSAEASSATSSSTPSAAPSNPYTITVTADGSSSGSSAANSDSSTASGGRGEQLRVSWQASDLDGDDLLAKVEFRGEDETRWKLAKDDIAESQLTLPSEALADGRYRFRVTVSDRKDNPGDTARTAERVSSLTLVDHTPPTIQIASSTPVMTRFSATDQASPVVAAHYSVDAGEWVPLRSDDGVTDSLAESFTISTEGLASGEHLVTFRVRDRAGNAGLAKSLVVRP